MNAQYKSSFYKFVGGPGGGGQKQVWPPNFSLGGHGPSLYPPLAHASIFKGSGGKQIV